MKNKVYLKRYLVLCTTLTIIFILVLALLKSIELHRYNYNFNVKVNSIVQNIKENYSEVDVNEILEILNRDNFSGDILEKYGIDLYENSAVKKSEKDSLIFGLLEFFITLVFVSLLIYLFLKLNSKKDREIDKIIKCIEDINHKNYDLHIEDISEDKLSILKNEIYKTTVMLKEQAENSIADKKNLKNSLEDISHQLKTPLTSILIMLDDILDNPTMENSTKEEFLRRIRREVININYLVQSLLKLSKFDSNTISFQKENVKLSSILEKACQNVSTLCDLKEIEIITKGKNDISLVCDYNWETEAITNILKNAVEHSNNGSKVIIETSKTNVYSQIKITDFGCGMSEKDMKKIFDRFYKCQNSSNDSIGIGLSLAKKIIEYDNGRISVESEIGKGTTFTIKYFTL